MLNIETRLRMRRLQDGGLSYLFMILIFNTNLVLRILLLTPCLAHTVLPLLVSFTNCMINYVIQVLHGFFTSLGPKIFLSQLKRSGQSFKIVKYAVKRNPASTSQRKLTSSNQQPRLRGSMWTSKAHFLQQIRTVTFFK